jgi:hypothetical protein
MSLNIWTQCAGASEIRRLRLTARRVVESQYHVSTRKLVDSLEEQALLEQLIERVKPVDRSGGRLHVLLATPFRYPPLAHGSRFGTRHDPGLWYGSGEPRALFAEVAYYRLVFLEGTHTRLDPLLTWHTSFTVQLRTELGIDLASPPFDAHHPQIASRTEYAATQALGADMRRAGVEAFRYPSARDVRGGANIGVFTPAAFGDARPRGLETWHCTATRHRVEIVRRDFSKTIAFAFPREEFLVDGRLPAPAV